MSYEASAAFEGVIGITGKIPSMADFVERGLPGKFVHPWSAWVDAFMQRGSTALGADWTRFYLVSPPWRFLLSPGCIGPYAWTGLMLPCSDSIGRVCPLTIAIGSLPSDLMPCGEGEFLAMEGVGLDLADDQIELDVALERIARIMSHPIPKPPPTMRPNYRWSENPQSGTFLEQAADERLGSIMPLQDGPARALFWHDGWGDRPPARLVSTGLPPADAFASLVDGTSLHHGWLPLSGG